jgi:hypothetical protein
MPVTNKTSRQFSADIAKPDKSDFHDCTQFFKKRYPPMAKVRAPSMRGHN